MGAGSQVACLRGLVAMAKKKVERSCVGFGLERSSITQRVRTRRERKTGAEGGRRTFEV